MPSQVPISVLMPIYNAEGTVDEAVASILNQTERDFEFIIVDDGSTDATPALLLEHAQRDKRIRLYPRQHHGIVSALNFGLKKSTGRYVARMDADDMSSPERLKVQRNHLDRHPETGLVSCRVKHLGDKKQKAGYARYVRWINSLVNPEEISLHRFIESPLAHPSVMYRKEIAERFGVYRQGPFPEDYELWLRWLEQGIRMEKVPEVLLQWRDEPDRLSRAHERYSFDAFYNIKAEYLARWLQSNNPHHPEIVVWGAGRTSRKRAELLTRHGLVISSYIDVDLNKIGQIIHNRPVQAPEDAPEPGSGFIVSYVGLHGVGEQIREYLENRGYKEGTHFIFAA